MERGSSWFITFVYHHGLLPVEHNTRAYPSEKSKKVSACKNRSECFTASTTHSGMEKDALKVARAAHESIIPTS